MWSTSPLNFWCCNQVHHYNTYHYVHTSATFFVLGADEEGYGGTQASAEVEERLQDTPQCK